MCKVSDFTPELDKSWPGWMSRYGRRFHRDVSEDADFYSHFFKVGQIREDVRIDCRQHVVAQVSETERERWGGGAGVRVWIILINTEYLRSSFTVSV